jgi:CubicO group peptidase (beta-lactamase class C family)
MAESGRTRTRGDFCSVTGTNSPRDLTAPERLDAADAVLRSGVADGLWPGIVAAVGVRDSVRRGWVLGCAEQWAGGQRAMTADTVFDLASLTKVLATLPGVLLLVRSGQVGLDDPVADSVPGVDPRVTVRQLLTHTAGLPAHVDLSHRADSPAALVAAAAAQPLIGEPGAEVVYSDLGFILLGGLVAAVTGTELAESVTQSVFAPLGVALTYAPPPAWLPRIAATELVDGRPVLGRVHDENAAAAGGRVGHAGLFGTLEDVRGSLALWWPGGPLLPDDLRAEALRDQTAGRGGHRGLGWTARADGYDILSDGWGPAAVSHTGFTGTSVALDAASGRWAVLLTNAVHFGRGRPEVFAARRRFHEVLVAGA